MPSFLPRVRRAAYGSTALALAVLASSPALAEAVTLRSLDGQFVLSGELVEAKGGVYRVRGALGELSIDAARVVCEGAACPVAAKPVAAAEPVAEPAVTPAAATPVVAKPVPPVAVKDPVAAKRSTEAEGEVLTALAPALGSKSGVQPEAGLGFRLATGGGTLLVATDPAAVVGRAAPLALVVGALPVADGVDALRRDIVAYDALAVVVHPSNPTTALTLEQLRDIYAGRITRWSEVGGPDSPIRVLGLGDGTARRDALERALFGAAPVVRAAGSETVADPSRLIASDPLAIAFVPQARQGKARVVGIKDTCGLVSSPDLMALKTGTYPLVVPVSLVSRPDQADPLVAKVLQEAQSAAANASYAALGLIDRGIKTADLDEADYGLAVKTTTRREARLAEEKRADILLHDRLSTTFYFPFAATELDAAAQADLARLSDHLAGLPKGSRILVVGFSDDVGRSKRNQNVSTERARKVAEMLQEAGGKRLEGVTITSKGFGDIAPVACNETESGRSLNRRVEIWIEQP